MSTLHSNELFEKNPNIKKEFPLLILDVNNNHCIPPRLKFHEMHWHEDIQITYVIHGTIQVQTLDHSLEVQVGQAIFINKKILHQITEIKDAHYRSFLFPDMFMQFYQDSPVYHQVCTFLNQHFTSYLIKDSTTIQIIQQINDFAFCQKEPFYIYQMLIYINQLMLKLIQTLPVSTKPFSSDQNLSIQKCLSYIHTHYQEDITLNDIATYGDISAGYCGRLFQKILKTSPYEYLIDFRIQKSLELMTTPHYTITQIATSVGFNSVSHFIQCFKKKLKMTPKQYQKQISR